MRRHTVYIGVLIVFCVALTGCAEPIKDVEQGAGFFTGLWDGITAWFALIGSLFGGDHGIYDVANTGGWYDFGFLVGAGAPIAGILSGSN